MGKVPAVETSSNGEKMVGSEQDHFFFHMKALLWFAFLSPNNLFWPDSVLWE